MKPINKITSKWITAYINRPNATCILEDNNDSLSATYAVESIRDSLQLTVNDISYPVDDENNSIKIDDIRNIQRSLHLKADKSTSISRLVIINNSQRLTHEAQNALLKLLEELPKNTAIILQVDNRDNLLPTIVSRSFMIPVLPVSKSVAVKYASGFNVQSADAERFYIMSDGNLNIYTDLLLESSSKTSKSINTAKEYISSSTIHRIAMNEQLVKDKLEVKPFISNLELVAKTGMRLAKNPDDKVNWKNNLKKIILAKKQSKANVTTKLLLLNLAVDLN